MQHGSPWLSEPLTLPVCWLSRSVCLRVARPPPPPPHTGQNEWVSRHVGRGNWGWDSGEKKEGEGLMIVSRRRKCMARYAMGHVIQFTVVGAKLTLTLLFTFCKIAHFFFVTFSIFITHQNLLVQLYDRGSFPCFKKNWRQNYGKTFTNEGWEMRVWESDQNNLKYISKIVAAVYGNTYTSIFFYTSIF